MKLSIQKLTTGYAQEAVLNGLSLDIAEGEFLSLLGPSGCGKTTLMKAIAGILPARTGKILLDGRDITALPIHKRGTVIVFQDMRLFPHKTVAENVAFPLKMQGVPQEQRLQQAQRLLEKVQMGSFCNRRPMELSGGQQQRIALARALAAQPKLLLLDEPFSALDENLREEMRTLVLELQKEFRMTVILVTHDREEALSMSDRVALMFDGQLIQTGTPRQVYTLPVSRQVADYFGDCTYLSGSVKNGWFSAPGIRCPAEEPNGDYCLMLRADSLDMDSCGDYRLQVETVSYRGSDTQVTFRAEDGARWKKDFHEPVSWQPGSRVSARLTPRQVVLFPSVAEPV